MSLRKEVIWLLENYQASQRRICGLMQIAVSSFRYRSSDDYGAMMSLRWAWTWIAARLEASHPPPSALTRRTLVTSF